MKFIKLINAKMPTFVGILTFISMINTAYSKSCLCWVYYFHVVRQSVRLSVTFCFLNILKSHCWNFINLCKHFIFARKILLTEKEGLEANSFRVISLCCSKWLFIQRFMLMLLLSIQANQLLPQLLILCLNNVDTLNICIICMKEFGSEKIIFDKMTAVIKVPS